MTPTKAKLAIQLATRHSRLSAAISEPSRRNAVHTPAPSPLRQRIDQILDAVLGADRAGHGAQHRGEDHRVRHRPQPDIMEDEGKGAAGVTTKIGHACLISACECRRPRLLTQRHNAGNAQMYEPLVQKCFVTRSRANRLGI